MFTRSASPHRLQAVPLFSGCTADELDAIDSSLTEVRLEAGQVLAREGHYGSQVVFVVDGQLAVTRSSQGDRPVAILGAGDIAGEMAVLEGTPRNATVTAITPATVYVANPREFAVLMSVPSVAAAIRETVERRHEANRAA
jgi:CRP/FNR family transcriptional regulator